jgi:hypothetical protein
MKFGRCGRKMIAAYQTRNVMEDEQTATTGFFLPTPLLLFF